jgi:parvulin-like peptidyl-prolyl isomerase
MSRTFPYRSGACALALLYLAGDLWIWNGPVFQLMGRISRRPGNGEVVAMVCDVPVLRTQLDRATERELWFSGHPDGDTSPAEREKARDNALRGLIDQELLRSAAASAARDMPVSDVETDAELARFSSRFTDQAELDAAMKGQGIANRTELRGRLAARLQQEKFLEATVAPAGAGTDAEARAWYDSHHAELAVPERVRVRHIFVATLERDPKQAKQILETALAELSSGKRNFAELAAALSEDDRSKTNGGDLGWIERTRMPADFSAAAFALPQAKPALTRTHIGWHLVEITGRARAAGRPFEQAREEIIAALTALKRRDAAERFRTELREEKSSHIRVFPPPGQK